MSISAKKIKNYFSIYANFMLISCLFMSNKFFADGWTTQNYSSEPHKITTICIDIEKN